jgi:ribosomal protection tetracycline resistance protein
MIGITELLPASAGDPDGAVSGTVFKIERGANGEKIAYVRMFTGTIHTRDRLRFGRKLEDKVTAITVFDRGPAVQRPSVSAGGVAKLWGLPEIQIGDRIGEAGTDAADHHFPPPTLESVVVGEPDDRARLRVALAQLAEQDPLINVRQDDTRQEISVSLYGEVQKEVIQATLANEFGLDVTFSERSAPARRSSSSTRNRIRFSPRSGCASSRRLTAAGLTSDCRSTPAQSRSTSTRRSQASRSTWGCTFARRCGRASSDGR